MDHTHLTPEQYAPIVARLTEERDYLKRLADRMAASGFPASDPLHAAVVRAWEAASNACVVACTCRNRDVRPLALPDTIMTRKPWGGGGGRARP